MFEFHPCHVFRLPPTGYLSSALWEGGHIWTGKVRVVRKYSEAGTSLPTHSIHLLEIEGDVTFAVCPLKDEAHNSAGTFQVANDSSRCFVLRVEQGDQHAYLGINFEEKADAFRFCTAVVERNKRLHLFAQPHEDAASRYANAQNAELRATGKIEVDLLGKWAQPQHHLAAGASPASSSGFSLDHIPRAAGNSRRVGGGQQHGVVMPPSQPPVAVKAQLSSSQSDQSLPPKRDNAVAHQNSVDVAMDPFADFPSVPSARSSGAVEQTAPTSSAAALDDPFAGLEVQQARPTGSQSAPVPTATKSISAIDAFF